MYMTYTTTENSVKSYQDVNVQAIVAQAHLVRAVAFSNDLHAVISAVKKLVSNVQAYFRVKATVRTLENLSDTVLADIGIQRGQIPSIARDLRNGTYGVVALKTATIDTLDRKDAKTITMAQSDLPLAA
jgi:uncharacterized protein YjiS (DUF1127 family)